MNHIFNSLNEFYSFLTSSTALARSKDRSHPNESNTTDEYFTQSKSLDDALDMLLHGTSDPRYDLAPEAPAPAPKTHYLRTRSSISPVGYAPHVPNALLNLPNSMITRTSYLDARPQPAKAITIVRDVSYPGHVDAERIRTLNLETTQYIRSLLLTRPAPTLSVYAHIGVRLSSGDAHHVFVRVKAPGDRLVIPNLNFAFCHPSFLRRCFFRWEEVSHDVSSVPYGYGAPVSKMVPEAFPHSTVLWIHADKSVPDGIDKDKK